VTYTLRSSREEACRQQGHVACLEQDVVCEVRRARLQGGGTSRKTAARPSPEALTVTGRWKRCIRRPRTAVTLSVTPGVSEFSSDSGADGRRAALRANTAAGSAHQTREGNSTRSRVRFGQKFEGLFRVFDSRCSVPALSPRKGNSAQRI
jgi:hypothetical protein